VDKKSGELKWTVGDEGKYPDNGARKSLSDEEKDEWMSGKQSSFNPFNLAQLFLLLSL
jgi:hypothetical protein